MFCFLEYAGFQRSLGFNLGKHLLYLIIATPDHPRWMEYSITKPTATLRYAKLYPNCQGQKPDIQEKDSEREKSDSNSTDTNHVMY